MQTMKIAGLLFLAAFALYLFFYVGDEPFDTTIEDSINAHLYPEAYAVSDSARLWHLIHVHGMDSLELTRHKPIIFDMYVPRSTY